MSLLPFLILALGVSLAVPAAAQTGADTEARFELPVPGGEVVLARLGLGPEERGTALALLARARHGVNPNAASGSMGITASELFGPGMAPPTEAGPPAVVLAPFSDAAWRRLLTLDARTDLFMALLQHRGALVVAGAALSAPAATRTWLSSEPALLREIVLQRSGAFAQLAEGLEVNAAGVQVPGGAAFDAAWTALVGAPPARAAEFVRRLLQQDDGRLARFYGTVARLDPAWLTRVLEPLPGETVASALAAVSAAARQAEAPSPPRLHPFQLSYADFASVLHSLHDLPLETLPRSAGHWAALLDTSIDSRAEAATLLAQPAAAAPLAAAVRAMLRGAPRRRRDQVATIALARRLWRDEADAAEAADAVYALAQVSRLRALPLTLDRIGVRDPSVWARLVDAARRVDVGRGPERDARLLVFQGALAVVERTSLVGSLSPADRDVSLTALADAVDRDGPVDQAVRGWLLESFIPRLPPLVRPDRFSGPTAYESRVLQAMAGVPADTETPFAWEGLDYVVDVVAAEHQRILSIRDRLPSPGLDAAVAAPTATGLGAALRAIVYAPALGDPEGAVTLSPDVPTRHEFGGRRAMPGRGVAWQLAQERTGTGAPWHLAGSLLGLDLALARSALRHLSVDDMPAIPTVNLNDQMTLARTAVAFAVRRIDAGARDALAAAIARGRTRLRDAGTNPEAVLALASELAWPAATRQSLIWTLTRMPGSASRLFGIRDLLIIGRPGLTAEALAPWGVLTEPVDTSLVPRLDGPVPWNHLAGRPDIGVLATQVPDLLLRLVEITAERQVPAALLPSLLLFATQDYWHDVEARFADDWPAMVRGAAALSVARVEDYVAALGSAGPLRPR